MKSDNGLWYEFGLFEFEGRIYDGPITQVLIPPVGVDEKAVIQADNGQKYDVTFFTEDSGTPEERTYLDISQTPSTDPLSLIDLPVDDVMYRMILFEDAEDSRIYHDWLLWTAIPTPVILGGISTFIRPTVTRSRYRVGV